MNKTLTLAITVLLTLSTPALAAGTTLSEEEMDAISAGDWVVLEKDADQELIDYIHFNNNDIKLDSDSQRYIQAVSQANVVDSAVAVQTNIANVSASIGPIANDVEGHNSANIANYNPAAASGYWEETTTHANSWEHNSDYKLKIHDFWLTDDYSSGKSLHETNVIDEDLVIAAALVGVAEAEGKKGKEKEFVTAAAFALGYTYDENYDKSASSYSDSDLSIHKDWYETEYKDELKDSSSTSSESKGGKSRTHLSEENVFDLEGTPQTNIQAVSNLNSLSAGAGIQTNLGNNVGAGGSIIHSNAASVANGL